VDMCPYCGEDLKGATTRCPRCGTALVDEPDGELLDVDENEAPGGGAAAAVAAPPGKKPKKLVPCPHCEARIPETAHRCPECGRALKALIDEKVQAEQTKMKLGGAAVLGGVALVLVLAVVIGGFVYKGGGGGGRGEEEVVKISFSELETLFGPSSKTPEARREERWKDLEEKYVVLEATVVKASGSTLLLRHRSGKGEADARVDLRGGEEKKPGLREGAKIRYKARLKERGGRYGVVLDDAEVVTVRD